MRTALLLLALSCAAPATARAQALIQRRSPAEIADGVLEPVGALTYSVDESGASATLRVGTSDSGTLVVSDPWAVHVAPTRLLDPSEYTVVLSNATWTAAGEICFYADATTMDTVGGDADIRLIDPTLSISSVRWDARQLGGMVRQQTLPDGAIRLVGRGHAGPLQQAGYLYASNIAVRVWASPSRGTEWDATAADTTLRDTLGAVRMSGLRRWITDRYDGRTAEYWSEHPATDRVRANGHAIWYNPSGTLRSEVASNSEWRVLSSGVPVIRVLSDISEGATPDLSIVDLEIGEGDAVSLYVLSSLNVPIGVQCCTDLRRDEWEEVAATSTYPSTVSHGGVSCYQLTVPGTADATRLFRATATVGGTARALRLADADCALYIGGVRAAWTNITVGGNTIRVLAAQP